jgi:hypothetical protein
MERRNGEKENNYLYVLYLKSIEATKQKLSRKGETNRENKKEKGKL